MAVSTWSRPRVVDPGIKYHWLSQEKNLGHLATSSSCNAVLGLYVWHSAWGVRIQVSSFIAPHNFTGKAASLEDNLETQDLWTVKAYLEGHLASLRLKFILSVENYYSVVSKPTTHVGKPTTTCCCWFTSNNTCW